MPLLVIAGLFALQGMLGKQPFEIYIAPTKNSHRPMVEIVAKYRWFVCYAIIPTLYMRVLYASLFLGGGTTWLELYQSLFVAAIPMSIALCFQDIKQRMLCDSCGNGL